MDIGSIVYLMKSVLSLVLLLSWPALAMDSREAIAQRILLLTNQARQQAGVQPLSMDPRLSQAAEQHSQEMDRLRYFAHASPIGEFASPGKRMNAFGFYGLTSGENLHRAQGYSRLRRRRTLCGTGWPHRSTARIC